MTPSELRDVLLRAGFKVGDRGADIGVVVGGDGRFSRYGRTESVPILFVGVRSKSPTGSKAYLAETTFDQLPSALERVASREYTVREQRRLEVLKNGRSLGEVYTDAYLCRGAESTCIRYKLKIRGEGASIDEAAIGDGVVFSTAAGATGYYSYPDRIRGDRMDPDAFASIGEDEVGICHVTPTFTERSGTRNHPLRYTVPWGAKIEVSLFRKADARLYGTADSRKGVKVVMGDRVVVQPGKSVTKVISLRRVAGE